MSQTQTPTVSYHQVFQEPVIPQSMTGQNYPHASTTVFTSSANNLKEEILIIDSRYRNWDQETQSNYTCYLGQSLDYIQSIELVDGCVLSSNYVINDTSNVLILEEKGHQIQIEIPVGIYTIESLCQQIETLMTQASTHGYTYRCFHDPLTDLVTIQTTTKSTAKTFDLIWSHGTEILEDGSTIETSVIDPTTHRRILQKVNTGRSRHAYVNRSVGPILGFLPVNLTGQTSYTGQQVYNLYPNQYLALHLTTDTHDDCTNVYSQVNAIGNTGAFAILNLAQNFVRPYGVHHTQYTARRRFTRFFNPPIRLSRLRIEIMSPDGSYYDFHGLDHYLMLIIQRVYNREILGPVNQLF